MKKPSPIKIIVVCGQTATGKSALAVKLARRFNGEIISADSRQVYRGMDIGTDKITKREMRGIPHHLLDVVNPRRQFSVALYKKMAEKKIKEINWRKKIPILAGGTGFYISAVVDGFTYPAVRPDARLRKKLSQLTTAELFSMLKKLDLKRALTIEAKNPRRLIRAIEIARALGKVPCIMAEAIPPHEVLKIGLTIPQEILKEKIKYRFLKNFKNGILKEILCLHKKGLSWQRLESFGLYYKYAALFLRKKISYSRMVENVASSVWQYARHQMTWFKRDKNIKWFDMSKKGTYWKIKKEAGKFLQLGL